MMKSSMVLFCMLLATVGFSAQTLAIPGQGSYSFDSFSLDDTGKYPAEGVLSQDSSFILGNQGSFTFSKGEKLTFAYEKVAGKVQGFVTYGVPKKNSSYNIPGQGSCSFIAGEPITCDYVIEKTGAKCYITSGAVSRQYTFSLQDGSKMTVKAGTIVQFTYEKEKSGIKGYPVKQ